MDNGIVFARSGAEAHDLMHRCVEEVRAAGLPVHDIEEASTTAEVVLGRCGAPGGADTARPARRVRQAIRALLEASEVRSSDVEKCSATALVHRPHRSAVVVGLRFDLRLRPGVPVWPSVDADLKLRLCERVVCCAASEWGFGLIETSRESERVQAETLRNERWRFSWQAGREAMDRVGGEHIGQFECRPPETGMLSDRVVVLCHKWERVPPRIVAGVPPCTSAASRHASSASRLLRRSLAKGRSGAASVCGGHSSRDRRVVARLR